MQALTKWKLIIWGHVGVKVPHLMEKKRFLATVSTENLNLSEISLVYNIIHGSSEYTLVKKTKWQNQSFTGLSVCHCY